MPPSRAVLEFVNKLGTARAAELREYVVQLASACTPAAMTAAFGGMYSLEEGVLADVAAPASWDFVAAPAKSLPGQTEGVSYTELIKCVGTDRDWLRHVWFTHTTGMTFKDNTLCLVVGVAGCSGDTMPAVALRDVIDTQGTEAALVLLLMIVQQLKVTINAADLVFALENDGAARVCKESIDECGGILLTTHSLVEPEDVPASEALPWHPMVSGVTTSFREISWDGPRVSQTEDVTDFQIVVVCTQHRVKGNNTAALCKATMEKACAVIEVCERAQNTRAVSVQAARASRVDGNCTNGFAGVAELIRHRDAALAAQKRLGEIPACPGVDVAWEDTLKALQQMQQAVQSLESALQEQQAANDVLTTAAALFGTLGKEYKKMAL